MGCTRCSSSATRLSSGRARSTAARRRASMIDRIGVAGAGTMGRGSHSSPAWADSRPTSDPSPEALEAGERRVREGLAKGAERGRWSASDAEVAGGRLRVSRLLEDFRRCELVIEAAPEDPRGEARAVRTSGQCAEIGRCSPPAPHPPGHCDRGAGAASGRVVGMHFFNPPVLIKLVEVVAGDQSAENALAVATGSPGGWDASRFAPPTDPDPREPGGAAVRPRGAAPARRRVSTVEQIDRIVRVGGGFRMGPFELADLIGVDVNFEVAKSFYAQSFHEPQWRPDPGADGAGGPARPQGGPRLLRVRRRSPTAPRTRRRPPRRRRDEPGRRRGCRGRRLSRRSGGLREPRSQGADEITVGYYALPPIAEAPLVELTRTQSTSEPAPAKRRNASSAGWASTSSGSATHRASFSGGSCARS